MNRPLQLKNRPVADQMNPAYTNIPPESKIGD